MLKLLCPCCYSDDVKVVLVGIKCNSCRIVFKQEKAKLKEVEDEKS